MPVSEIAPLPAEASVAVSHDRRCESTLETGWPTVDYLWGVAAPLGGDRPFPRRSALHELRATGIDSYRFTVDWAEVMPDNEASVDQAGLERYSELVDRLLEADIEPIVTLGHGRQPSLLEAAEGWSSGAAPVWFTSFAGVVGARLGDRVRYWETMRSPFLTLDRLRDPKRSTATHRPTKTVAQHVLAAHDGAVRMLRAHCPWGEIGLSIDVGANARTTIRPHECDIAGAVLDTPWLAVLAHPTISPIDMLGIRYGRGAVTESLDDLLRRAESIGGFGRYLVSNATDHAMLDRTSVDSLRSSGLNIIGYLDER